MGISPRFLGVHRDGGACVGVVCRAFSKDNRKCMAALQCACGDVFTASCEVEPVGCAVTWLLLLLSVIMHAMHWCATDECESDDDTGPETMYS